MATITYPSSPNPQTMQWKLEQPTQVNVSAWTGARQAQSSGRGWWECSVGLPPIVGTTNFNQWRSFLASCRGGANEFRVLVDPTPQWSDTVPSGTQVFDFNFTLQEYFADGAQGLSAEVWPDNQTGRTVTGRYFPENETVLVAGEFVTINDQLLQLTADVVSDANGDATLTFEPPLRNVAYAHDRIYYQAPYALMYLKEIPSYSVEPGYIYSLRLEFQEAF